jgi:hypothetical protein
MNPSRIVILLIFTAAALCPLSPALGSGCPGSPNQSHGPDVVVSSITGPENYLADGTRAAITFGADACNLGDQLIDWFACPATTHPVFGGNLYRWSTVNGATRFEQIGQSWLKHGFGADQGSACCPNCQPGPFTRLGVGCDDAYLAFQAGDQNSLGPKSLVNAHTGVYPSSMCFTNPSGGNAGLLEVEMSDLVASPGGIDAPVRFFGQFQYVTADDAAAHNQNNNASSREIAVTGPTPSWHFTFAPGATTQQSVPAIRLWKTFDAGVIETDIATPEDDGFSGVVILDAKATDLGNGFWHYEYAVNNLNSDRSIGSFSVPCSVCATVQNIGFHDVAYLGGDGVGGVNYECADWPGTFANGAVTWATTPFATSTNANAIRWGTLYNFRFDANVPPQPSGGSVTLKEFKVVTDLLASTVVPSPGFGKGDLNGDGLVNGADIPLFTLFLLNGGESPIQTCAGDVQPTPDGAINEPDIDPFVTCILNGACP